MKNPLLGFQKPSKEEPDKGTVDNNNKKRTYAGSRSSRKKF